jgi:ribosomal protein S8
LGYRIIIIYKIIRIDLKYLINKPVIRYLTLFIKYNIQQVYNINQTHKLGLNFSTLLLIFYTKLGIKTLEDCKKQNLNGQLLAAIC